MNFPSPDPLPGGDVRSDWVANAESRQSLRMQDRYRRASLGLTGAARRPWVRDGERMFPFKIYLAQIALGQAGMLSVYPDQTTWWRTFLVRCGEVNGQALTGNGCDNYDTDPDSDFFQAAAAFQVPAATDKYYVWIDTSTGSPVLTMGTDITGVWPTYPEMDGIHWLIGIINTAAPYQAVVRQTQRADIVANFIAVQVCVAGAWKPAMVMGALSS